MVSQSSVYANSLVDDVNLKDIKVVLNGNDTIEIDLEKFEKLDNIQKQKIKNYISQIGIKEFKQMLKKNFKIVKEKEEVISSKTLSSNRDISLLAANGDYYKEKEKYRLIEFEKGYTIEYIAIVGIDVNIKENKITKINSTSFRTESMSVGGGTENLSFEQYVDSNGSSAGATANYDVYKSFFIGDIVPVKYTKTTFDYVIAYPSDF